jgi:hypothetical protein
MTDTPITPSAYFIGKYDSEDNEFMDGINNGDIIIGDYRRRANGNIMNIPRDITHFDPVAKF